MPDFAQEAKEVAGGGVALPLNFYEFSHGGAVSDEMSPGVIPLAFSNIRTNCARGLPTLRWQKARPEELLICGGGPSIKESLPVLREEIAKGGKVFAINDTYDWLIENDIIPDYFGMCEIEPWPIEFVKYPHKDTVFCLPSLADVGAFERLKDYEILLWHCGTAMGEESEVGKASKDGNVELLIYGGEAMSIRAVSFGSVLGFRRFQMFGVDGSGTEGASSHVYHDRQKDDVPGCKLTFGQFWHAGRIFWSHHCYARQMLDLIRYCRMYGHMFTLKTHGDGLVQHAHRMAFPDQYSDNPPLMRM